MDEYNNAQWLMLVTLSDQLKISDGKYKDAVKKYESVGEWLQESEKFIFKDSIVYPQGSVRIGTTVKPYALDEYDIDLVVHLPHVSEDASSEEIKNAIGDRLRENKVYAKILEPLKRGWRINYAGDFYLDITPAIPDDKCNNACPINKHYAEHVPDSKLMKWKPSNPRGFAEWFCNIDEVMPTFATDSRTILALESKNVESVPSQDEFKGVLKRAVQLLKRHRDTFFNEKRTSLKEWAPISILITTLAAHAYKDLVSRQKVYNPVDLIKLIVKNMGNYILINDGTVYVGNPTNLKENFAEKWKDDTLYLLTFNTWIEAAYKDLENMLNVKGMDKVGRAINESFGGHYGNKVIAALNTNVDKSRSAGALAGIFALNEEAQTAPIAKNTFYGSK